MAPNIPKPDIGSGRKKDRSNKNVLKRDPDEVRSISGRAAERDPLVAEDKSTARPVKPRIRGMKQDPDTMRSSLNDLRNPEVVVPAFRRATATSRTAASFLDFNLVNAKSKSSTKVKREPEEVTSAVRGISSRHKTRSSANFPFAASHQRSAMPDHVASRSKNSTKVKSEPEEVTIAVRGISTRHKTRSSDTFSSVASHQRTRTYQSVKKEPDNRKPVARKRSFEGVDSSVARENRNCSPTAHVPRLDVQEPRRSPSVKESSNKKQKTSNSRNNVGYGRCQPDSGGGTALVRHSMNMDNGILFLAVATAAVCLMSVMLLQSTAVCSMSALALQSAASSEDEDSSDEDY